MFWMKVQTSSMKSLHLGVGVVHKGQKQFQHDQFQWSWRAFKNTNFSSPFQNKWQHLMTFAGVKIFLGCFIITHTILLLSFFWTVQKLVFCPVRKDWMTKGLVVTLLFHAQDLGWEGHAESFGHLLFLRPHPRKRLKCLIYCSFAKTRQLEEGLSAKEHLVVWLTLICTPFWPNLSPYSFLEPNPRNVSYFS